MYQDLLEQYNSLCENDKKVLLIYKSRLFKYINDYNNILCDKELYKKYEKQYELDKKIICSLENKFIRYSIFNDVNFESYDLFLKSINEIKENINLIIGKITLPQDSIVYRGTTVNNKSDIVNISKSDLISTSLNLDETDNFYTYDGINVLYQISLKKETPCLVIPYSIKLYEVNGKDVLKISENDSQNEIIVFKSEMDLSIKDTKYLEDDNLVVLKIETDLKKHNIKKTS